MVRGVVQPPTWLTARRARVALATVGVMLLARGGDVWLDWAGFPDPGRAILYEAWPATLRASLWVTTGVIVLALAPTRLHRWGWLVACLMPAQRVVSHAYSLAHLAIPGYPPGAFSSAPALLYWLAIINMCLLLAGWPDQPHEEER